MSPVLAYRLISSLSNELKLFCSHFKTPWIPILGGSRFQNGKNMASILIIYGGYIGRHLVNMLLMNDWNSSYQVGTNFILTSVYSSVMLTHYSVDCFVHLSIQTCKNLVTWEPSSQRFLQKKRIFFKIKDFQTICQKLVLILRKL